MFKKEEVDDLIRKLVEKNKIYSENINFTEYCKTKMEERNIDKKVVTSNILSNIPYYAEEQEANIRKEKEKRYKLIYKVSSRYSLIIIIVYEEKILKVVNVIKTSKSAEKLWRKKVSR